MDVLNACPDYLKKSNTACENVYSSVIDSAPDIVMCNEDGYFLEIKLGKITNSLNLNNEVGEKVSCFYFCENEKPFIVYLVLTSNSKLFVIKRLDSYLEIIKVYEEIYSYEVGDFESLGYPELKICKSSGRSYVFSLVLPTEAITDELKFETNLNSVGKLLEDKLQVQDEKFGNFSIISTIPDDSDGFSLPLEKNAKKIIILSTWIKVIGDKLALGIDILNDGEKTISGLWLKMYGKNVKEYSYRFFPYDDSELKFEENPLFLCEKINSSVLPKQKITVVGAVLGYVHYPFFEKELQISCYLFSAEIKNYLVRKTFEINISDFFDFSQNLFSSQKTKFSVEELQAIKTAKSETKFKIKIKNFTNKSMEYILKNNMGFIEAKFNEDKLYYCNSECLSTVLIAFQSVGVTEPVWKLNFYASDE